MDARYEPVVDRILERAKVRQIARTLQSRLALAYLKTKYGLEKLPLDSFEQHIRERCALSDSSSSASDLPGPTKTLMSLRPRTSFSDTMSSESSEMFGHASPNTSTSISGGIYAPFSWQHSLNTNMARSSSPRTPPSMQTRSFTGRRNSAGCNAVHGGNVDEQQMAPLLRLGRSLASSMILKPTLLPETCKSDLSTPTFTSSGENASANTSTHRYWLRTRDQTILSGKFGLLPKTTRAHCSAEVLSMSSSKPLMVKVSA